MEALVLTAFIVASILIAVAALFGDGKLLGWGFGIAALGLIMSYADAATQVGGL